MRYNDVCSTYADQPHWQDGRSCLAGKEWTWSYQEVGHFTISFITMDTVLSGGGSLYYLLHYNGHGLIRRWVILLSLSLLNCFSRCNAA